MSAPRKRELRASTLAYRMGIIALPARRDHVRMTGTLHLRFG